MNAYYQLDTKHQVIESESALEFSLFYADGIEESVSKPRVIANYREENCFSCDTDFILTDSNDRPEGYLCNECLEHPQEVDCV